MTNDELFLALSNLFSTTVSNLVNVEIPRMIEEALEPVKADIREMKADIAELKAAVAELKAAVTELEARVTELEARVTELEYRTKRLEVNQENIIIPSIKRLETNHVNIIIPRLTEIESCYLSTYERYKANTEEYEVMKLDISVLKSVVAEHSEFLKSYRDK